MTLHLHGIKNDTDRSGFEVTVTPSQDPQICPVLTLQCYLTRTAKQAPNADSPVFLSLHKPYTALSAQSISKCLNEALVLAGLGHTYTAKDFRPTGATIQVDQGVDPKTVMRQGRWKTETVFFDHYVHSKAPEEFTDNILLG